MSWVKIWVHLVFSTKNRESFLTDDIRNKVFYHIKENAVTKDIWLDHINGWMEHCHCLINLNKDQSISKVVQLIKGESSFWINNNKLIQNFMWQDDYYAVSVGENQILRLRKYIRNQESHHRNTTFNEEIDDLVKKSGLEKISN
jgi:putative transposase